MSFVLEKVVPWGRSYEEYVVMFALTGTDLEKSILGCGDGPSAFNSRLTRRGGKIVSVDPLYQFSAEELESRINETYVTVLEQAKKNKDEFVWKNIDNIGQLGRIRMDAMRQFLDDYPFGEKQGRYVVGELPMLEFPNKEFELALC